MENCSHCGAETELYDQNIPICLECSAKADGEADEKGADTVTFVFGLSTFSL
jgi:hypothetical protein